MPRQKVSTARSARVPTTGSSAPELTAEQALAKIRWAVFNRAAEALQVAKLISEEAPTSSPHRAEISDAITLLRQAITQAGLELLRPVIERIKAVSESAPALEETKNESL